MFTPLSDGIIDIVSNDHLLNKNENRKMNKLFGSYKSNIIICGPTGSGKTNLLINLLTNKDNDNYDEITVFAPIATLESGIYESVNDVFNCFPLEQGIFNLYNLDKEKRHAIIFDDFLQSDYVKNKPMIREYLCNSSRRNATIFLLTQQYLKIEPESRQQCKVIYFMSGSRPNDIKNAINSHFYGEIKEKQVEGICKFMNNPDNKYSFFSLNQNFSVGKGRFRINNHDYNPL